MSKLPANIDAVDPLGEIRTRAKELWRAAGAPGDTDWTEFYQQAETELTAGTSGGRPNPRQRKSASPSERHPALVNAAESRDDLLAAIASSSSRPLDAHSSIVLGDLLTTQRVTFSSGEQRGPLTPEQAGDILAEVSGEYDENFFTLHGVSDPFAAPLLERSRYWSKRLRARAAADEAQTNADRNTLARLRTSLIADKRINDIS